MLLSFYSPKLIWLKFVPECYKNQLICDKAVNDTCLFVFDSAANKTQEMCDKIVCKEPFMLKHCLDKLRPKICVIKLLIPIY